MTLTKKPEKLSYAILIDLDFFQLWRSFEVKGQLVVHQTIYTRRNKLSE